MAITKNDKQKLNDFFVACNQMIDGRFILSDVKISKILNSIASSEILYNLFAKTLMDFNFKQELRNAKTDNKTNGGYFTLPESEEKIIALTFCLLLDVENGKLNLQSFINDNFYNSDGYNISYKNFANIVLVPFKNSVLNLLNVNEAGEELSDINGQYLEKNQINMEQIMTDKKISSVNESSKLAFANLLISTNEMYSMVLKDNKIKMEQKEEIYIVVSAINDAVKLENIKIINALIIPLEYLLGKNKGIKPYFDNVKENLLTLYKIFQ